MKGGWKNNLQQGKGEHSFASGHYDIAMWDQGLRHGPATYFHPNGNKEEATYVEGYEEGESTVYYSSGKVEKRNYAKVEILFQIILQIQRENIFKLPLKFSI